MANNRRIWLGSQQRGSAATASSVPYGRIFRLFRCTHTHTHTESRERERERERIKEIHLAGAFSALVPRSMPRNYATCSSRCSPNPEQSKNSLRCLDLPSLPRYSSPHIFVIVGSRMFMPRGGTSSKSTAVLIIFGVLLKVQPSKRKSRTMREESNERSEAL